MKKATSFFRSLLRDKRIHLLRRTVQGAFALFCLYTGYRFYQFYLWASSQSTTYVARPPSVEAFLPIGALVNLKRLILTGKYDIVHPAGLTIFVAFLCIGLLLRKGFCGWICPVGFASNLAESIGRKFSIIFRPPAWLDYPLLSLKYILLFFFCYLILLKMDLASIESFNQSTYNMVVDAKMLFFFLKPSDLSLWILLFLVTASFFSRNFWCRYFCPYGALLGILAFFSPLQVRRKEENCIDCKKCDQTCPGAIRVSQKATVRSPECVGCGECVSTCPAKDCLTLSAPGRRRIRLLALPALILGIFFLFYLWAILSGHWHSEISPETMKQIYSSIKLNELAHP